MKVATAIPTQTPYCKPVQGSQYHLASCTRIIFLYQETGTTLFKHNIYACLGDIFHSCVIIFVHKNMEHYEMHVRTN